MIVWIPITLVSMARKVRTKTCYWDNTLFDRKCQPAYFVPLEYHSIVTFLAVFPLALLVLCFWFWYFTVMQAASTSQMLGFLGCNHTRQVSVLRQGLNSVLKLAWRTTFGSPNLSSVLSHLAKASLETHLLSALLHCTVTLEVCCSGCCARAVN